tara:strand:- start:4061 stop:5410 length:1350 start_codon:yes stop_codon:yes gene_type:complete
MRFINKHIYIIIKIIFLYFILIKDMATKELTTPQIRKLVKAHNVLMSIKIPVGATRAQILAVIAKKGYEVDHQKKKLKPKSKTTSNPTVSLTDADKVLKKPEKTALQKQKALEAKEKKQDIQKKKERELKKEAVKKAQTKKPDVKKPDVKKPDVKKPLVKKKEDDVRPKDKVGRPRFDPKKIKVIKPKSTIGTKPQGGGRIETGTLNKGNLVARRKVKKKKTQKELQDEKEKLKKERKEQFKKENLDKQDKVERRKLLNRVKSIKELQDGIEQFNDDEKLQIKAEGRALKKPLEIKKLKTKNDFMNKILAYNIDKVVKFTIQPLKESKAMTPEQKKQKRDAEKAKDNLLKPIKKIIFAWKQEFKDRKIDGQDEKELLNELEDRWDVLVEEHEDGAFDDEEFFDDMEKVKDTIVKHIKGEGGAQGRPIGSLVADNPDYREGFKKKSKKVE